MTSPPVILPFVEQAPRQHQYCFDGETERDGRRSSWSGQSPRSPSPCRFRTTPHDSMKAATSCCALTSAIASAGIIAGGLLPENLSSPRSEGYYCCNRRIRRRVYLFVSMLQVPFSSTPVMAARTAPTSFVDRSASRPAAPGQGPDADRAGPPGLRQAAGGVYEQGRRLSPASPSPWPSPGDALAVLPRRMAAESPASPRRSTLRRTSTLAEVLRRRRPVELTDAMDMVVGREALSPRKSTENQQRLRLLPFEILETHRISLPKRASSAPAFEVFAILRLPTPPSSSPIPSSGLTVRERARPGPPMRTTSTLPPTVWTSSETSRASSWSVIEARDGQFRLTDVAVEPQSSLRPASPQHVAGHARAGLPVIACYGPTHPLRRTASVQNPRFLALFVARQGRPFYFRPLSAARRMPPPPSVELCRSSARTRQRFSRTPDRPSVGLLTGAATRVVSQRALPGPPRRSADLARPRRRQSVLSPPRRQPRPLDSARRPPGRRGEVTAR